MPLPATPLQRLVRAAVRLSPLGRGVRWSLPPACGAVLLTFDDGPDPDFTPAVLDCLKAHGATATFFLIGGKASERPELVERIMAEGHAVGSHTFSHRNLREVTAAEARREMRGADAALAAIGGRKPAWFRPPYGGFSPASLWEAARAGQGTVLWNVDPRDYRAESATEILERLGPLDAGQIVLLHDRSAALVEAVPEILARVADAGLKALSIDAALAVMRGTGARVSSRPEGAPEFSQG